jgi:hypothetical protein
MSIFISVLYGFEFSNFSINKQRIFALERCWLYYNGRHHRSLNYSIRLKEGTSAINTSLSQIRHIFHLSFIHNGWDHVRYTSFCWAQVLSAHWSFLFLFLKLITWRLFLTVNDTIESFCLWIRSQTLSFINASTKLSGELLTKSY